MGKEKIIGCETCLYAATHEKCDGCLNTEGDWATYRKTGEMHPFRYLNYEEGNWIDRVIQAEIEGKKNIVIGGMGEAEVNVKWTPKETAKHLRMVSECCGYVTGCINQTADYKTLCICKDTGEHKLVWKNNELIKIVNVMESKSKIEWENVNPFRS